MRPAMLDGLVEVHACLRFDEEEALVAAHDERLSGTRSTYDLVTWRRARSDALLAPVAAAARGQVLLPDRVPTEERRAFLLPHEDVASARAVITALTHLAGVETECTGPLPPVSFVPAPPI
ncbi:gas vesicle protein GvpL/GvpF [Actinophytocola oryzae]|uniref:Gas vesicle protein GvpL/GvpF n=2 Tax=Actinophytocola oryzae TaxID=502181 RepID=A0A4R7W0W8_9PSEU|nr:gas vesicle protein GvpL/GvpF [Actinophytocola oryzae]